MGVISRGRASRAVFVFLVLAIAAVTRPAGTRAQDASLRWDGVIEQLSLVNAWEATGGVGLTSRQPVSADGRYVVWSAEIPNPPHPSNTYVFRRDRQTGEAGALIGMPVQGPPVISAEGHHVGFVSCDPAGRPDQQPICDVYVMDVRNWTLLDASNAMDGRPSTDASSDPVLSRDGRFVVFQTKSPALLPPGAAPGQIVLRNRDVNENGLFDEDQVDTVIEPISMSTTGEMGNDISVPGAVSADGRFVAFRSLASNLVQGDTNNTWDVFLRDRLTLQTRRVNISEWNGLEATPTADSPAISMTEDGRFIAFAADDGYLTDPPTHEVDVNNSLDVIVFDRVTAELTRIDLGPGGQVGNGHTYWPMFSGDGRYISMVSTATNIDPTLTGGRAHVYVYDRVAGAATRVSAAPDGTEPDADSVFPAISADGSLVTFMSQATNLTTGAPQGQFAVYGAAHFDVLPLELTIPSRGGQVSATITAQRYVSWRADLEDWNTNWVQFDSAPWGTGSATVSFSAGANPDPTPRSEVILYRSRRLVIAQEAGLSFTSMSPMSGPATGGTTVTLNGTGFEPDTQVFFDSIWAPVEFVDSTTIRTVTPAHAAGDVYVWVQTSDSRFALLPGQFHYRDATPPDIWMDVQGTLHSTGWYTSDVNVQFAYGDPDSAIVSVSGCGQTIVNNDTNGTTYSCTVTSEGGTASKQVLILRDTRPPFTHIFRPEDTLYRLNETSNALVTCNDAGAGLASCIATTPSDTPFATSVPGYHTFTIEAVDILGHVGTSTRTYAVSSGVCDARPEGLIAWWPGDYDYRDVIGGHDGVLINSLLGEFVSGISRGSMRFMFPDGKWVQVGDTPALKLQGAMTLSAWIFSGGTNVIGVIAGREGEYLLGRHADGRIRYSIANADPGWGWVNTDVFVDQSVWTHLALTYDGTTIRLYKNGQLAYSRAGSGDIGDAEPDMNDFRIGARQNPAEPSEFGGNIDNVEVAGRAMTTAEIETAFLSARHGHCVDASALRFEPNPQRVTYGQTSTELVARLTRAGVPEPNTIVWFKLRGTSVGGYTTDANGIVRAPVSVPQGLAAGTYVDGVEARVDTNAVLSASTATADFVVDKVAPAITWNTPAPIVYGTALSPTQLNAAANVSGSFDYTPPSGTVLPASSQTLSVTFTPLNANYQVTTSSVTLVVNKAASTVTVDGGTFTYDGVPHAATGSVTGVGGASLGPLTFTYNGSPDAPVNAGTYEVVGTYAGDSNYAAASAPATLTINKATPAVTVTGGTFIYDTTPHAATGSVTGVGGATLGPLTLTYNGSPDVPVNAGSYAVVASFAGDANYHAASAATTLRIDRATPKVVAFGGAFTYDGLPHTATGSVFGIGGIELGPLTFTYNDSPDVPVNAGSYVVIASYAGNTNYRSGFATTTVTIAKATPTVSAGGGTFTYDGAPHAATGSVTGVGGATLGPLTFTYDGSADVPTSAGSYAVVASFAGDANYRSASATATLTINKATPTVSALGGTFTYDGTPHPATGSVTGVGGATLGPLTFTYNGSSDVSVNAGSYVVIANYAGDANYDAASATVTLTIAKADPTVNALGGMFTYDGTPHPATGSVTGIGGATLGPLTFTYNGSSDVPVNAGSYAVVASFAGDDNYAAASGTADVTIGKATPSVTATGGEFTYDGQPHAGTGSVTGVGGATLSPLTFTYNEAADAPVNAGSYAVVASFAGDANYDAASATASITIGKATAVLQWNQPAPIVYGTALGSGQLNATANTAGTFAYTPAAGAVLAAGTAHAMSVTFTPDDGGNYDGASAATAIDVSPAPLTVRADDATKRFGAPLPSFTATITGLVNSDTPASLSGTLAFATTATAQSAVGTYPIVPSGFSSSNYAIAFVNGTLSIVRGAVLVGVSASPEPSGLNQPMTFSASVSVVSPAVGNPGGVVRFFDGATLLGSKTLDGGSASLTTAGLAPGTRAIEARYEGDASFETGTGSASHAINDEATTPALAVSSSRNPSNVGQSVTLTVDVTMAAGPVTGSVQFYSGAALFATAPISAGRATLTTSSLPAGSHAVTARYAGSGSVPSSYSPVFVQAVGAPAWKDRATTMTLATASNPAALGDVVVLTASVTGSTSTQPTGRILVMVNGTVVADQEVTPVSGSTAGVTVSLAGLAHGNHIVTATYLGDSTFKGSTAQITQGMN